MARVTIILKSNPAQFTVHCRTVADAKNMFGEIAANIFRGGPQTRLDTPAGEFVFDPREAVAVEWSDDELPEILRLKHDLDMAEQGVEYWHSKANLFKSFVISR